VVEKVYRDLLDLRIPLTPANVLMYLKVLYREGGYQPLNRVDIVGRYLAEMLGRPSDIHRDSFNIKNKLDVVSAFAHTLYMERHTDFDDRFWANFVHSYQQRTLVEFDGTAFLTELIATKVFVRHGSLIFFRYTFFFSYFLGRYISQRSDRLSEFMTAEEYLAVEGIANRKISYWNVLGGLFRVSQFKCLIRLDWCGPSGNRTCDN